MKVDVSVALPAPCWPTQFPEGVGDSVLGHVGLLRVTLPLRGEDHRPRLTPLLRLVAICEGVRVCM